MCYQKELKVKNAAKLLFQIDLPHSHWVASVFLQQGYEQNELNQNLTQRYGNIQADVGHSVSDIQFLVPPLEEEPQVCHRTPYNQHLGILSTMECGEPIWGNSVIVYQYEKFTVGMRNDIFFITEIDINVVVPDGQVVAPGPWGKELLLDY